MNGVTLEAARSAKAKVATMLGDAAEVNGIGITQVADGYAVKVNLSRAPQSSLGIPTEVDGVPVVVAVVGPIRKQ